MVVEGESISSIKFFSTKCSVVGASISTVNFIDFGLLKYPTLSTA